MRYLGLTTDEAYKYAILLSLAGFLTRSVLPYRQTTQRHRVAKFWGSLFWECVYFFVRIAAEFGSEVGGALGEFLSECHC